MSGRQWETQDGEEEVRAEPWDPLGFGVGKGRGPSRGGRERRPAMLVGTRGHGSFQEHKLPRVGEDGDGAATCGPGATKAIGLEHFRGQEGTEARLQGEEK